MATIVPGNSASPFAVVHYYVDESGVVQQVSAETPYPMQQSVAYNLLTTAGTTTVDPGPGVFYGVNVITPGTASTIQVLDGTNALTGTLTDQSAGALAAGIPSGVGVRYLTSLVVITAGTAVSTAAIYSS
jgi:hypothetical protein